MSGSVSGIYAPGMEPELSPERLELVIPPGLTEKADLLEHLRAGLGLPDYFGGNWDALEECLRDLSWIAASQIVLRHEAVPPEISAEDQGTYRSILTDAVAAWAERPGRELIVVLPE